MAAGSSAPPPLRDRRGRAQRPRRLSTAIVKLAVNESPGATRGSSGPPLTRALVGAVIGSKAITASSAGAKTWAKR